MTAIAHERINDDAGNIRWASVSNADTVVPASIYGGEYTLTVSGVLDGATVTWTTGTTLSDGAPMSEEAAPVGGVISGAVRSVNMNTAPRYLGATITGGGSSQSITLTATRIRD